MDKLLSICTAAYNAADFVEKMIGSIENSTYFSSLQLILVNDGSKDHTLKILKDYEKKFPNSIIVIDQENGGSGSARNAAFRVATGKYMKLIDADDWIVTEQFDTYLKKLSQVEADMVLNPHYEYVSGKSARKALINSYVNLSEKVYGIDDLPDLKMISMHDVTYRTCLFKEHNLTLSEGKSFVDMEYLTIPIPFVESVAYIDNPFYVYQLGLDGQSVNPKVTLKKHEQKVDITKRIQSILENGKLANGQLKLIEMSLKRVGNSLVTDYMSVDSLKYLKKIKENERLVNEINPVIYEDLGFNPFIRVMRGTNYLAYYPIMLLKVIKRKLTGG